MDMTCDARDAEVPVFKPDDRVSMEYHGRRVYGTVTIPLADKSKVMFDKEYDPDYDYYPNHELKLEKDDAGTTSEDMANS